jgi:hypothetical protein
MHTRHLIFSDCHGQHAALQAALKNARYNPVKDVLISLGDLVDGKQTREAVEFCRTNQATLLVGNHEAQLIEALSGNVKALVQWVLAMDGTLTMQSYGFDPSRVGTRGDWVQWDGKQLESVQDVRDLLIEIFGVVHLDYLFGRPQYHMIIKQFYPGVDAFLSHAGAVMGKRLDELEDWQRVWGDSSVEADKTGWSHKERVISVYGHFHNARPVIGPKRINVALYHGVSVLSLEEHKIYTYDGQAIDIDRRWLRI